MRRCCLSSSQTITSTSTSTCSFVTRWLGLRINHATIKYSLTSPNAWWLSSASGVQKFLKFNQFHLIQSSKFSPYEYVKIMLHNQYCINEMLIRNGVMDHYSEWCHGPLFPMVSWTIINLEHVQSTQKALQALVVPFTAAGGNPLSSPRCVLHIHRRGAATVNG